VRNAANWTDRLILFGIIVVAAGLVLPNLGANCLWEDEAQTALVARNILSQGVPAASDGKNSVSIFADHRDVRDGIHIWQGWFPSYLAAASMGLFGKNAWAARFPFAVAFIALVAFYYLFLKRHKIDSRRLWLTILLTSTCVPLLVHARQCRYYLLVPILNLLIVDAYLGWVQEPKLKREIALLAWTTLLLNSFFPGALLLGFALVLDLLRRRPARNTLTRFAITATVIVLLNLPMAVFCRIWNRQFATESIFHDPGAWWMFFVRYLLTLNNYFFPGVLVLAACVFGWKAIARKKVLGGEFDFLFLAICAAHLIALSVLSDFPFTRYMIGITPFLMFFAARCLEIAGLNRSWMIWPLAIVVINTNLLAVIPLRLVHHPTLQDAQWTTAGIDRAFIDPNRIRFSFARGEVKTLINISASFPLIDYVRSLVEPPQGPDDVIVDYLHKNAAAGDRVKTSYAAQTLMFHTSLAIIDPNEIGPVAPEWMVLRRFRPLKISEEFMRESNKYPYTKITIPFPDLQWNNQPDPLYHFCKTPSNDLAPPIVILKKS